MRVRLFTAAHDDRSGVGVIGSRLGLQRTADTFGAHTVFDRDLIDREFSQDSLNDCIKAMKLASEQLKASKGESHG